MYGKLTERTGDSQHLVYLLGSGKQKGKKKKKERKEKQGLVSRSCQHHTPIEAPLAAEILPLPPGSLVLCARPPLSV